MSDEQRQEDELEKELKIEAMTHEECLDVLKDYNSILHDAILVIEKTRIRLEALGCSIDYLKNLPAVLELKETMRGIDHDDEACEVFDDMLQSYHSIKSTLKNISFKRFIEIWFEDRFQEPMNED